jgi:hypothetical protein
MLDPVSDKLFKRSQTGPGVKMKRPQLNLKRLSRRVRWPLFFIVVGLGVVAIAQGIGVINLITPSGNTTCVNTCGAPTATGPVTASTICNAGTGAYSQTISPFPWGTVVNGTTAKQYLCVQNTGSGPYTIQVASTLPSTYGTITSPQTGANVLANGFLLVELDWAVAATAPSGSVPAFSTRV